VGAVFDPLGRNVDFAHCATVYPLGFAFEVRSNSPNVIAAARESWGSCVRAFDDAPLELLVSVSATDSDRIPPEPTFRAQRHQSIIVADSSNFACIDSAQGVGFIWVTESVAADSVFLRWFFLEAAVYSLLSERRLTPLHAGCISRNGRGVLLLGESGAGKSTLAFAAARAGWSFVGDDVAWLITTQSGRRVLGPPHHVRLLPDTTKFFPELANRGVMTTMKGKACLAVSLSEFPNISLASECDVDACVFLHLGGHDGQPSLRPLAADETYERLLRDLVLYDEATRLDQIEALRRLAEAPAFDFYYDDLDTAVEALGELA
jgi:hypothetical protein